MFSSVGHRGVNSSLTSNCELVGFDRSNRLDHAELRMCRVQCSFEPKKFSAALNLDRNNSVVSNWRKETNSVASNQGGQLRGVQYIEPSREASKLWVFRPEHVVGSTGST